MSSHLTEGAGVLIDGISGLLKMAAYTIGVLCVIVVLAVGSCAYAVAAETMKKDDVYVIDVPHYSDAIIVEFTPKNQPEKTCLLVVPEGGIVCFNKEEKR